MASQEKVSASFIGKITDWVLYIAIFFILITIVKPIINGSIPFWYDPARDLLSALDNLSKPTLIGQPTGIPGLFYGPYWIWFLSLPLLISRNPRFVVFTVSMLPYITLFPFLLLRMGLFTRKNALILYFLFIANYSGYLTQMWNPHPAPLLFLALFYLISNTDFTFTKKIFGKFFIIGVVHGLLINFSMSIGIAVTLATGVFFLFFLLRNLIYKKIRDGKLINKTITVISTLAGFGIVFIPFMIFELRHGFNQIKSFANALSQAAFHNSAVVGQVGLDKPGIISNFMERGSTLFRLTPMVFVGLMCMFIIFYFIKTLSRVKLSLKEQKIWLFVLLTTVSIFLIFLTSKNPVWGYHFIGVEIIFLVIIGLLSNKIRLFERLLFVWLIILFLINLLAFVQSFSVPEGKYSTLAIEEGIVTSIYQNADKKPFAVYPYNRAIYTYDYDYLFRWMGQKYGYFPETDKSKIDQAYLIIPKDGLTDRVGFTDNKTSNHIFYTTKVWDAVDGTIIIKRLKK